jgi:nucleotide-binding universal stress UspA family protein
MHTKASMTIRQILVPIDFSESSMEALLRAVDIARPLDATLTLLHVIDYPGYCYSVVPFVEIDFFMQFEDAARAQLDEVIRRLSAEYPKARASLRQGSVSAEVLSEIEKVRPDLVVMGTHGRHGVARAMLGSVAERVVRFSPVPVLTVHQREAGDDGSHDAAAGARRPIRKILVPIDFGDVANHALDVAIDLAAAIGATVTVLHAYEYPSLDADVALGIGALYAPPDPNRTAQEALSAAIEPRRNRGVVLEGILREGNAASKIVESAKTSAADLIVMGTHGRRGLARTFIGSVAEQVVRSSSVPVLTVHASEAAVAERDISPKQPTQMDQPGR